MLNIPEYYNEIYKKNLSAVRDNLISSCDKCNHTGYIETGDNMFIDCDCIKEFYRIKPYIYAGIDISNALMKKDFIIENFNENTIKKINAYLKEKPVCNVMFFPETNKSWGADVIAKYILRQFIPDSTCAVVTMKQLITFFFDYDNDKYKDCLLYFKSVDNLLIEGVGFEYNLKMKEDSSYVINSLNGFLSERSRHSFNKRTFISSGFTKETLHKEYSKEFVSLLIQKFVGVSITSNKKEDTEYDVIIKKKPDIGFEDLDIIKPDRKHR